MSLTGVRALGEGAPIGSVERELPAWQRAWPILVTALLVVIGLVLAWSRLMALTQSFWSDEAYSIAHYASVGPGAIWSASKWVPNDQPLFELLTWATAGVLAVHAETVYRLWGVLPAIAATVIVPLWMWRRLGSRPAIAYAVLAVIMPLYFELSSQARGYGLGFLAAAGVIIGADGFARRRERSDLVLLGAAGFLGIATLQNFAAFFLAAVVVLGLQSELRKPVLITTLAVGLLALAWYAPLLSAVIGYKNLATKSVLGPLGFLTAPFMDTFGSGAHVLLPPLSVTVGAIIGAAVAVAGLAVLVRRGDRILAALLGATALASYLVIELAPNAGYAPRFASFVVVPLMTAAAVGLMGFGVRSRWVAIAGMLLAVVALVRFMHFAGLYDEVPYEQAQVAGMIVEGQPQPTVVLTNHAMPAISYYFRTSRAHAPRSLVTLANVLCSHPGRLVYLAENGYPHPSTTCLQERGAFSIALREHRQPFTVWLVPAFR